MANAASSPNHHPLHLADINARPRMLQSWERVRHRQAHWAVELFAEAFGVFAYVYPGVGATAAYVVGNTLALTNLGSILTVGFGYSLGIVFALVIGSATSGGHFNPGVTISFVIFKGFPKLKAVRYIIAQILGSYLACLLVYVQWHNLIKEAEAALVTKGTFESVNFTSNGPAGIMGLFVTPGSNLGFVFVNEYVVDILIGIVIWATLDPTNLMIPPPVAPWLVGFVYGIAVWGFAAPGLATNTARDLGGRFAAMTIYGRGANGGPYAAIAALTNIVSTATAYIIYEVVFKDSSRVVTGAHVESIQAHAAHMEHRMSRSSAPSSPELGEKVADKRNEVYD